MSEDEVDLNLKYESFKKSTSWGVCCPASLWGAEADARSW